MPQPDAAKPKTEAQLWKRLRTLKERHSRTQAEYAEELAKKLAEIDAEITSIKATLGEALEQQ